MARSRFPLRVRGVGAFSSSVAWSRNSQFPARVPRCSTSLTRSIATAVVPSSSPLSAFSRASFYEKDRRRSMVKAASNTTQLRGRRNRHCNFSVLKQSDFVAGSSNQFRS